MSLKRLVITNPTVYHAAGDLIVTYTTDMIEATQENFTILAISGLTDAAKHAGFPSKQVVMSLAAMKIMCRSNNLQLDLVDANGTTTLQAADYSDSFSSTINTITNIPGSNGNW
jgi:hypothetical protein